ncbi:hypothetical protein PIB30_106682, partial [Stylosanthes scabra]|nr:hypothetical protein [Stylosanthes scabra]
MEAEFWPTSTTNTAEEGRMHSIGSWMARVHHPLHHTNRKQVQITIARAILIHSIIRGEDVRAEELIANNIAVIAQGMQEKGKLAFPSTIFKLCKDAQVPMREFKRTELIPQD